MSKIGERFSNGIIKENPIFIMTLGMCPTLAVTTSAINGLGMGLSTLLVLACSNLIISILRKFIPEAVRIPSYIVLIATLVTIVQFLLQGFVPDLYDSLGVYIPLIVVNCILLGRAESYAAKNGPVSSFFDGIGMGLGFTMALTIIGIVREFLGSGTFFGQGATAVFKIPSSVGGFEPCSIFVLAPGAFFVLAIIVAVMNGLKKKKGMSPAEVPDYTGEGGCTACEVESCAVKPSAPKASVAEDKKEDTVKESVKTAEEVKEEED